MMLTSIFEKAGRYYRERKIVFERKIIQSDAMIFYFTVLGDTGKHEVRVKVRQIATTQSRYDIKFWCLCTGATYQVDMHCSHTLAVLNYCCMQRQ